MTSEKVGTHGRATRIAGPGLAVKGVDLRGTGGWQQEH